MPKTATGSIRLLRPGEPPDPDGWVVSDWDAGQSSVLAWSPDNVRVAPDGAVELALGSAPPGATRSFRGGEIQSVAAAATGTWSWTAQAPRMTEGAVFGLFTYRADHFADPWTEFDLEFVGADTRRLRLNIHMETANGEHVTLEQGNGGQPIIAELGFDASQGLHAYAITVTETGASFLVDGREMGRFDASDMPGRTWTAGPMRGFANLWCVGPSLHGWAGAWAPPDGPLVARLASLGLAAAPARPGSWFRRPWLSIRPRNARKAGQGIDSR